MSKTSSVWSDIGGESSNGRVKKKSGIYGRARRMEWDPQLEKYPPFPELQMPDEIVRTGEIDFLKQEEREEYIMRKVSGEIWKPISYHEVPSGRQVVTQRISRFIEGERLSFMRAITRIQGTALISTLPQILFQLVNIVMANLTASTAKSKGLFLHFPDDIKSGFTLIGAPLAFLLVTRVKQAYTNYIDGRKSIGEILNCLREVAQHCYTHKIKPDADPDICLKYQRELRRRLILTFSLMRQALRESRDGFVPGSEIEGKPFDEYWHLDPCVPPIGNLLSTEEKLIFQPMQATDRVFYSIGQLKHTTNLLSEMVWESDFTHEAYMTILHRLSSAYSACYRVVELYVPFPYCHLCYFLVFIYVYLAPWIQASEFGTEDTTTDSNDDYFPEFSWESSWVGSIVLCLAYYTVLEIAAQLQNPFGHDPVDLDLEIFGKRADAEIYGIAVATNSGDTQRYDSKI